MFFAVLVAVKKVFGIINDLAPCRFEVAHGVTNHRLIFLSGGPENFGHLKLPAFPENSNDRRLGIDEKLNLRIFFDGEIRPTRRAKGCDLGVIPGFLGRSFKKLDVFWVRSRPATFDIVHPELVETLGNSHLIQAGEEKTFALRAIAESRIVYADF